MSIDKDFNNKVDFISNSYDNFKEMFDDLETKLELLKALSVDNEALEYSIYMYVDDIQTLLKATELKIEKNER